MNQIEGAEVDSTPTITAFEQVPSLNVMIITDIDGVWQDVLNDTMTHQATARDIHRYSSNKQFNTLIT